MAQEVLGATRDYMQVSYRGGDTLFVPYEQMELLHKYVGGDGARLDKLGGATWAQVTDRVRKRVKALAGELLRLHAAEGLGPRLRFPRGWGVGARARGGLPLPGDPGPGGRHLRRQDGHAEAPPDGPPGLRGRWLRQDRGLRAGRLQGGARRQADHDARPDDHPRAAARADLQGAARLLCRQGREPLALHLAGRPAQDPRGLRRPGRWTCSSGRTRCSGRRSGPRTSGSSWWTRSSASACRHKERIKEYKSLRGRPHADGDPDPTHHADGPRLAARHKRDRDAPGGAPQHPDPRRPLRRGPGEARHRAGGRPRRTDLLRPQPRREHRRGRREAARAAARCPLRDRARADAGAGARRGHAALPRRAGRRARHDHHRRERARRGDGEHPYRGPLRRDGPRPALPAAG